MALYENFDAPQRTSPAPVESLESRVTKLEADVKELKAPKAEAPKPEPPKAPDKK